MNAHIDTLTITGAAERAGLTRAAVWSAIQSRALFARREDGVAGGRWIIPAEEFIRWRTQRALTAWTRARILDRIVSDDRPAQQKEEAR